MVKVPIGEKVTVNLWDSRKKRGLVKYFTNTMHIVNAESEYELKKSDRAIVIKSYDSFVVIIPDDEYSDILRMSKKTKLDIEGLSRIIGNILDDWEENTGGILSIDEVLELLMKTPLENFIKINHLKKMKNLKDLSFDVIKYSGMHYFALKPHKKSSDVIKLLEISAKHDYLTYDVIKKTTKWSDLRINRISEYLNSIGVIRIDRSYKDGIRYYFVQ